MLQYLSSSKFTSNSCCTNLGHTGPDGVQLTIISCNIYQTFKLLVTQVVLISITLDQMTYKSPPYSLYRYYAIWACTRVFYSHGSLLGEIMLVVNKSNSKGCLTLRARLHEGGGPQIGEATCGGSPHLSCKRDQIKMRDFVDRRVTSPTWGPPPPCKQALNSLYELYCYVQKWY